MEFKEWLEKVRKKDLASRFPKVMGSGDLVDGRHVLGNVENISSINASLYHYDIMPGIRRVKTSEFPDWNPNRKTYGYSVEIHNRNKWLAEKIKKTNRISPLIVVFDKEGCYVLEGSHRFVALQILNAKELPALVVVDLDEIDLV